MQQHLDLGLDNIPDILQYLSAPQLSVADRAVKVNWAGKLGWNFRLLGEASV